MNDVQDLTTKRCVKCGNTAEQIINTEQNERVGWWCIVCDNFERAILRERVWIKKVGKLNGYNND